MQNRLEKVTGSDHDASPQRDLRPPTKRPASLVCARSARLSPIPDIIIALVFFTATGLLAQQAKPSEYQVKAAYLYNFGRFIKWPAGIAASKGDSFPFACSAGILSVRFSIQPLQVKR